MNFQGGLAAGASTFFSLETAITSSGLVVGGLVVVSPVASIGATEGSPFSGTVAIFTDTDTTAPASQFSAMINWGDSNTSTGTVSGGSGSFTVWGSHTYVEEGSYPVSVTVTDSLTKAVNTGTTTASVADAALSATGVSLISANPVNGVVANFSDADPSGMVSDYTATISWGDGNTTAGTVAASGPGFSVSGTQHLRSPRPPHD